MKKSLSLGLIVGIAIFSIVIIYNPNQQHFSRNQKKQKLKYELRIAEKQVQYLQTKDRNYWNKIDLKLWNDYVIAEKKIYWNEFKPKLLLEYEKIKNRTKKIENRTKKIENQLLYLTTNLYSSYNKTTLKTIIKNLEKIDQEINDLIWNLEDLIDGKNFELEFLFDNLYKIKNEIKVYINVYINDLENKLIKIKNAKKKKIKNLLKNNPY